MSKPVINETIVADDPTKVTGQFRLYAQTGGGGVAYTNAGSPITIGQVIRVSFDSSGALKADDGVTALQLNPNSGSSSDAIVTPTGTVWEYEVRYPNTPLPIVRYLTVTDVAGPLQVASILTTAPSTVGSSYLPLSGGTVTGGLTLSNSVTNALVIPDVGGAYNALVYQGGAPDTTHPQFLIRGSSNGAGTYSIFQVKDHNGAPIGWLLNAGGLNINDEIKMVDDTSNYVAQIGLKYLTSGHRAGFALSLGTAGNAVTSGFVSGTLTPSTVTWAANAITVTPASPVSHPAWYVGQQVVLSGFTPSGYNGTYTIATIAGDFSSFTVTQNTSLAAVSVMGTVAPYWDIDALKLTYIRANDNGQIVLSAAATNQAVIIGQETSANAITIGKIGPANQSGISISVAGDTKLYRDAIGSVGGWVSSSVFELSGITNVTTSPFKTVPAKAATTGNITLSLNQTIDGVAVANPDRVLVKNQTNAQDNGIYTVVDAGAWTRTTDADTAAEISAASVAVQRGTLNGGSQWQNSFTAGSTLGTTPMTWGRLLNSNESHTITPAMQAQALANTVRSNATNATADISDLAMGASTTLARLSSGNIVAATPQQTTALNAQATFGYPVRNMLSGFYAQPGGNTTTATNAANTATAIPFVPNTTVTATRLTINVTTNTATSLVRLGIYNDDGTGKPGTVLVDAGQVDTHTATGIVEATISQQVVAGTLYWLVGVAQTAAPTLTCMNAADWSIPCGTSSQLSANYTGWGMTGVSSTLPTWASPIQVLNAIRISVKC